MKVEFLNCDEPPEFPSPSSPDPGAAARELLEWLQRQGQRPIVVVVTLDGSPGSTPGNARRQEPLRWLRAAVGRAVRLIDVDDVYYFCADTKYTRIVTAESEALIERPLRAIRAGLDPAMFWSIHRSTIVNMREVAGVVRDDRGHMRVTLKRRSEMLAVSEARERLFRRM